MKKSLFRIVTLIAVTHSLLTPNAMASCGLSGTIESRIDDCSTHPEAKVGDFTLVTEADDRKMIYLQKKSGLLWTDKSNELTYPSAIEACSSGELSEMGGIKGYSWGLPTIYQYQEAIAGGYLKAFPRFDDSDLWTTSDLSAWNGKPLLLFTQSISNEAPWYVHRLTHRNHTSPHPLLLNNFQCIAETYPPCGEAGTVSERIQDCAKGPESKRNNFTLVARKKDNQIYLDNITGLLWSDRLRRFEDSDVTEDLAGIELYGHNGWQRPTINQFDVAERNGALDALPHSSLLYWTSTFVNPSQVDHYWRVIYRPYQEADSLRHGRRGDPLELPSRRFVVAVPKEVCGTQGTLKERISDCAKKPGRKNKDFVLVSRIPDRDFESRFHETYLDKSKNLLWSDTLYIATNCRENIGTVTSITNNLSWRLPTISELTDASAKGFAEMFRFGIGAEHSDVRYWSSSVISRDREGRPRTVWFYSFTNYEAKEVDVSRTSSGRYQAKCVANVPSTQLN